MMLTSSPARSTQRSAALNTALGVGGGAALADAAAAAKSLLDVLRFKAAKERLAVDAEVLPEAPPDAEAAQAEAQAA